MFCTSAAIYAGEVTTKSMDSVAGAASLEQILSDECDSLVGISLKQSPDNQRVWSLLHTPWDGEE
jgi:hypothetical protein